MLEVIIEKRTNTWAHTLMLGLDRKVAEGAPEGLVTGPAETKGAVDGALVSVNSFGEASIRR